MNFGLKLAAIAAIVSSTSFANAETVAPDDVKLTDGVIAASLTGEEGDPEEGALIFASKKLGNCLACHHVETPGWPSTLAPAGNAAPILTNLTNTYPDRNQLRDIIHDASQQFPDSFMPLYGKHLILEQNEINLIVKFLLTL